MYKCGKDSKMGFFLSSQCILRCLNVYIKTVVHLVNSSNNLVGRYVLHLWSQNCSLSNEIVSCSNVAKTDKWMMNRKSEIIIKYLPIKVRIISLRSCRRWISGSPSRCLKIRAPRHKYTATRIIRGIKRFHDITESMAKDLDWSHTPTPRVIVCQEVESIIHYVYIS